MPAKKPRKPARAGTPAATGTPETPAADKPAKAKIILPKVARDRTGAVPGATVGRDEAKKGPGHAQTFRPAPPRLPGRNG